MGEEVKGKTQDAKHNEQNEKRNEQEEKGKYICDRCGFEMYEKNCKIICPNCGNRFDCSDLNIYLD